MCCATLFIQGIDKKTGMEIIPDVRLEHFHAVSLIVILLLLKEILWIQFTLSENYNYYL